MKNIHRRTIDASAIVNAVFTLILIAILVFFILFLADAMITEKRNTAIIEGEILSMDSYTKLTSKRSSTVVRVAYVQDASGKVREVNLSSLEWAIHKEGDRVHLKIYEDVGVIFGWCNTLCVRLIED